MGGTVIIPGTHTNQFHKKNGDEQTRSILQQKEYIYYRADLNIGDCIIMDSRTFHYGSSNTSDNQRTLLYFTIRNPYHILAGYPNCGSLYPELDHGILTTSQYIV